VNKLSPTLRLILLGGVLLIAAAVLVSMLAERKLTKTAAGLSAAEIEIARLLPDLAGKKRKATARKIDDIVNRNDDSGPVLRVAMMVYSAAGMYEEAVKIGESYLERADSGKLRPKPIPKDVAVVASTMGMACSEIGEDDRALEYTERALKAFPNNPTYLNNLGYFLADQDKDIPRALKLTRRAVKLSPSNPSFIDSYGWALYKSGRYKEALAQLARATELAPNSAEVRYHLGAAYVKLDRIAEARIELKKSLIIEETPEARKLLKLIER